MSIIDIDQSVCDAQAPDPDNENWDEYIKQFLDHQQFNTALSRDIQEMWKGKTSS
jgi:hypothetical protein